MLGEKIEHNGILYSEEHKRNFQADKITAQVLKSSNADKSKLFLYIDGQSISDWFKEQFCKLRQTPIRAQRKSSGMKL